MFNPTTVASRVERAATVAVKAATIMRPSMAAARHARVAPAVENLALLRYLDPEVVIDVGANRGQFTLAVRGSHPRARVECIEPVPAARAVLEMLFADDPLVEIHACAAGAERGTVEINIMESDDNSSLLMPADLHPGKPETTRVQGTATVELRTLDELVGPEALSTSRTLLKIDVQGTELDVLRGASATIARVTWILLEASFVASYHGQAMASDLIDHLAQAGFSLTEIGAVMRDADGRSVQADLLFTNNQ